MISPTSTLIGIPSISSGTSNGGASSSTRTVITVVAWPEISGPPRDRSMYTTPGESAYTSTTCAWTRRAVCTCSHHSASTTDQLTTSSPLIYLGMRTLGRSSSVSWSVGSSGGLVTESLPLRELTFWPNSFSHVGLISLWRASDASQIQRELSEQQPKEIQFMRYGG